VMRERRFLRIPDEAEAAANPAAASPAPAARKGRISMLVPAVKIDKVIAKAEAETKVEPLRRTPTLPLGSKLPAAAAQGAGEELDLVMLDEVPRKAPSVADEIEVDVEEPKDEDTEVMEVHPHAETVVEKGEETVVEKGDAETVVAPGQATGEEAETVVVPGKSTGDEATLVVHDTLSLGPIGTAAAAMDRADDRDAVIDLLVHPFRYQPALGVVFLVRGQMAVGLAASTAEVSRDEVRGLVLPLATPSLLREAFSRNDVVQGSAKEDPLQQVIARYLRWGEPEDVCVAPIRHGNRVVNLLCVQTRAGVQLPEVFVGEVKKLCEKAAESYLRLIQRHKRPITRPPVAKAEVSEGPGPTRPSLPDRRFFVTGYVGQEGPAEVWRAIDTKDQRIVAVKLLPVGTLREDQIVELARVVRILGDLRHPHILEPVAIGKCSGDDGRSFLVTEYVGEHTLRARLERRPTPPQPEVAEIVRQLGGALAKAHARKVTHGDVRPENVLFPVPDKLQVKLGGFGMPRGIPAGLPSPDTARYTPPEGLGGPKGYAPADVYALAAMSYEMLGGELPIEGESLLLPPELPPLLPGVPTLALNVVARGLAQQPEQRPRVLELAQELYKALLTKPD
jgi:hypothetical protein